MPTKNIAYNTTSLSGNGQNELNVVWGPNPTRSQRSKTYRINGGLGTLTVSQEGAPALSITANNPISKSVTLGQADSWTPSGKANGRYIKYAVSDPRISVSANEFSNPNSGVAFGASYGSGVSNFIGGTQKYSYTLQITIPATLPKGNHIVEVFTSDSPSDSQGSGTQKSKTFTITVEEASQRTDVTSISVTPQSLTLGVNESYQLGYSYTPQNATIASERWVSGNTSIATVDSTGYVTGVAAGNTYIRCYVSSIGSGQSEVSDRCYPLAVYNRGTISVANMTIETLAQSGTSAITLNSIDTSQPITVSFTGSQPSWITSISVDKTQSPYRVIVGCYPNSSHAQDHTTTACVTGTDYLGNTIQSPNFTIYQKWETLCTAMTINGSSTIHDSSNSEDYTVSYTPVGTTQNRCVWSVSDSSLATVQEGLSNDECTVTALASGTITLTARNYYNSSIVAQKQITMTYVQQRGEIVLNPTTVTLPYNATTDNTVAVTSTGIGGNLTITPDSGGFITGGEIDNNHLKIYFSANDTTTSRSCAVVVSGRDDVGLISNTVNYTQEGTPVSNNRISVANITPVYNAHQDTLNDVIIRLNYINNGTVGTTFTSVSYTMTGYTDAQGTTVNFTKSGSLANRVEVTAGTTPVDYTIESVGALGIPARIDVTVTATNNSATLTASDTLHIN